MANKGKTILITGCSTGIGKALAIEFHNKGHRVFAASRTVSSLKSLAEIGIEIIQLDPTNADSIYNARSEISKQTDGKLDILINNAGQWIESPAIEVDLDRVKDMFDVNVFAVMEMNKQFIPLLIAAKGTIVNHGSILRNMPHPMTAAYNASKAALAQYSTTLRLELAPLDVKVVELVTGRVATGLVTLPTLANTSIYKPLEPAVQKRAREAETMQPTNVFAKAVVKDILSSSHREISRGKMATLGWVITTFFPTWAWDPVMNSSSGLKEFREPILRRALDLKK
ncbi:NAD(P)-binding protein [Microthyrium microscopicum]|uniref:NAD(P)-binding protein n=1 Tax=Microthyrium microscopicum TaxID=703497 RepID=A0A6A6UT91_9PEZI|nr:NAD(P)-binding protein [Microthyrium microscopicum]